MQKTTAGEPRERDGADPSLLLKAFLVLALGFGLLAGGVAFASRGARAERSAASAEPTTAIVAAGTAAR